MELRKSIKSELNQAMLARQELLVLVLRQLLAVMLNKEKELSYKLLKEKGETQEVTLGDEAVVDIVVSEIKKRKEAIELYLKGNRPELAEKEQKEIVILEKYLPVQLSEAEVKDLVLDTIKAVGAQDIKDMGKVMAELKTKVKGRAGGDLVYRIVRESLCR